MESEDMATMLRILVMILIVLLPREVLGEPPTKTDSCKGMALLQARFLLDEPDRQKELSIAQLELLGKCDTSMVGIDLTGRDLSGIRLPGADLTNAELAGAKFGGPGRHADLQKIDLDGANLEGADLRAADLRGADLRHTFLAETNFAGANLSGAQIGWPHAPQQAAEQKLTAAQLAAACWAEQDPPRLPSSLKDYERPAGAPSDCPASS